MISEFKEEESACYHQDEVTSGTYGTSGTSGSLEKNNMPTVSVANS